MDLKNIKPNKPKANLSDYVILCYGTAKAGKTTLFYDLAKEHFDGDLSKALLVATEKGYKALPDIHAVDINSWKDVEELKSQLIENKDELPYEWIGIDTLDYLYEYCVEYVVRRERLAKKDSKIQTIADIAWGQGYAMVETLMTKFVNSLISAGYGIFMITHEGTKQFTSRDGTQFDKTTLSLPTRARNAIINMCDFIIYISVEKIKDGTGLKDNRVIYLRSDSDIEAGSRFQNIPEIIPYKAKEFLDAFSDAVLNAYDNDVQAMEEASKEQALEKVEKSKEFIESETKKHSYEEMVQNVEGRIKGMNKEGMDKVKTLFKEHFGSINYRKFKEEQISKAMQLLEEMIEQG